MGAHSAIGGDSVLYYDEKKDNNGSNVSAGQKKNVRKKT